MTTLTLTRNRIWTQVEKQATGGLPVVTNRVFPMGRSRIGSPLPNWRQNVKRGISATTLFSGSQTNVQIKNGTATGFRWMPAGYPRSQQKLVDFYSTNVAQQNTGGFANTASEAEALNQCMTRLYKNLREEMYLLSGPTFIGEIREAVQMIRKPMSGLRNYAESYLSTLNKRKRGARRGSLPKVLADTWLEYSFGWSPFLSDIKSGAEVFAKLSYDVRRSKVKGYGESMRLVNDIASDTLTTSSGIAYYSFLRQTCHKKCIQTVGIDAKLAAPSGSIERLKQLSGFSMQNFIPTAWELLPWSFMVDYFSNIGDVISAQCTDTSKVTWTNRCTVTELVDARWTRANPKRTQSQIGGDFASCNGNEIGLTRSILKTVARTGDGPVYPTLTFSLPGLPRELANITALLVSGRKLQPFR